MTLFWRCHSNISSCYCSCCVLTKDPGLWKTTTFVVICSFASFVFLISLSLCLFTFAAPAVVLQRGQRAGEKPACCVPVRGAWCVGLPRCLRPGNRGPIRDTDATADLWGRDMLRVSLLRHSLRAVGHIINRNLSKWEGPPFSSGGTKKRRRPSGSPMPCNA